MKEYWFARRFSIGAMRSGMAPVHWKGWTAAAGFVCALAVGAAGAWWLAQRGEITKGVILFSVVAVVAMIGFIGVSHKTGDHVRTVADYREENRRA